MLRKASDTVDFISQKVKNQHPISETVTASFVTIVIELAQDAVETISKSQGDPLSVNLRFLKPSKRFYKKLICLFFKYLPIYKSNMNKTHLMEYVVSELDAKKEWREE